ncbi:unnamed protein product [Vitrella brassicaformis CCMP3155]|uniref:Uncharacterized protein n=2 Tax=Vitrella brassicaformis TaxID=1169539 RepID=A0A0G4EER1_VITBC|nr:unnamed protein product [Vitrella brassicaformis CCMP3155]|eukprot:CEL93887.1 unnamed protein product [Vitrella brassicaformis CCMP3155]
MSLKMSQQTALLCPDGRTMPLELVHHRGLDGVCAVFRGRWRPAGAEQGDEGQLAAFKLLKMPSAAALEKESVVKTRYQKSLAGLKREHAKMMEDGGRGPFLPCFEGQLDVEAPARLRDGDEEKLCIFVAFPWLPEDFVKASVFFTKNNIARAVKEFAEAAASPFVEPVFAEAALLQLTLAVRTAIRGLIQHLQVHKTAMQHNVLAQDNLVADIFINTAISNPHSGPLSSPLNTPTSGRMIDLADAQTTEEGWVLVPHKPEVRQHPYAVSPFAQSPEMAFIDNPEHEAAGDVRQILQDRGLLGVAGGGGGGVWLGEFVLSFAVGLAIDIVLRGETQRSFAVRGDPDLSKAEGEMPKEEFSRVLRERSLQRALKWKETLCILYDADTGLPSVRHGLHYMLMLQGHKQLGWVLECVRGLSDLARRALSDDPTKRPCLNELEASLSKVEQQLNSNEHWDLIDSLVQEMDALNASSMAKAPSVHVTNPNANTHTPSSDSSMVRPSAAPIPETAQPSAVQSTAAAESPPEEGQGNGGAPPPTDSPRPTSRDEGGEMAGSREMPASLREGRGAREGQFVGYQPATMVPQPYMQHPVSSTFTATQQSHLHERQHQLLPLVHPPPSTAYSQHGGGCATSAIGGGIAPVHLQQRMSEIGSQRRQETASSMRKQAANPAANESPAEPPPSSPSSHVASCVTKPLLNPFNSLSPGSAVSTDMRAPRLMAGRLCVPGVSRGDPTNVAQSHGLVRVPPPLCGMPLVPLQYVPPQHVPPQHVPPQYGGGHDNRVVFQPYSLHFRPPTCHPQPHLSFAARADTYGCSSGPQQPPQPLKLPYPPPPAIALCPPGRLGGSVMPRRVPMTAASPHKQPPRPNAIAPSVTEEAPSKSEERGGNKERTWAEFFFGRGKGDNRSKVHAKSDRRNGGRRKSVAAREG